MRSALIVYLVVVATSFTADARRLRPGAVFTASLERESTGATAVMTWTTDRSCVQTGWSPAGLEVKCRGRWECDGVACPGRRGRLDFFFRPDGFNQVFLRVSRRPVSCTAHHVGDPEPQRLPYHWYYQCFTLDPTTQIDSGTILVDLAAP